MVQMRQNESTSPSDLTMCHRKRVTPGFGQNDWIINNRTKTPVLVTCVCLIFGMFIYLFRIHSRSRT